LWLLCEPALKHTFGRRSWLISLERIPAAQARSPLELSLLWIMLMEGELLRVEVRVSMPP